MIAVVLLLLLCCVVLYYEKVTDSKIPSWSIQRLAHLQVELHCSTSSLVCGLAGETCHFRLAITVALEHCHSNKRWSGKSLGATNGVGPKHPHHNNYPVSKTRNLAPCMANPFMQPSQDPRYWVKNVPRTYVIDNRLLPATAVTYRSTFSRNSRTSVKVMMAGNFRVA